MATDKLRAHLARLIQQLRETGICLLDQMEAEGEISHEDRRLFQYLFCHGMGEARFIMETPKEAIACEQGIGKDKHIEFVMEHDIRMAAEAFVEYLFGKEWRVCEHYPHAVRTLTLTAPLSDILTKLLEAVRAKPSEVRERLAQMVTRTPLCPRCRTHGHTADECKLLPPGHGGESDARGSEAG